MNRLFWVTGLALLPMTGVAQAQALVTAPGSVPPLAGVTDRSRPDYDPIGGRIGSFFLYPRLDASVSYTDNLRATESDHISDETFELRPSADLVSNWSRNYLDLRAFYAKDFHANTTSENFSTYGASAASRLDFGRDTHLFLSGNVDRDIEPRTDINSDNSSRSPIRFSDYGVGANLSSTFNRLTLSGGTTVNLQRFDNAETVTGQPLIETFRNNTVVDSTVEGRYLLGGATSLIVHVERSQINYDDSGFTDFDRDSVGYTAQLGVGLHITSLIQGDIRVGYLTQNNGDPRIVDTSGVAFSANITYNVTPTTTIRLLADRSIEPGGSPVTTGNVRSTGAVTVEHELLRNLVVIGYGRYSVIDPQGPFDDGRELEGRLSAIYYLSRRFRFNANVDHYSRFGDTFGHFGVNNATLGVTVTL